MHKPEAVRENETRKILLDFQRVDFAVSADYGVKLKEGKTEHIPRPCQRTEKVWDHESDCDSNRS